MIIQDDAFLTKTEQDEYKTHLLEAPYWRFQPKTNGVSPTGEALASETDSFQFVCEIFSGEPMYLPTLTLLHKFLSKHQIPINQIIRIKSNILTKNDNGGYHSIHVDQSWEHKVFLYYINDSDGDTVFFNEFWSPDNPTIPEILTEQIRVAPKQGLGVVFDGLQYHCSTSPQINGLRSVINIDFI
jgi:hypothetical protein